MFRLDSLREATTIASALLISVNLLALGCGPKPTDEDQANPAQTAPSSTGTAAQEPGAQVMGDVSGLRIVSPRSGESVKGSYGVVLDLQGGKHFSNAWVAIDGGEFTQLRDVNSISIESLDLENGPHTFAVRIETAAGKRYESSVNFSVSNPSQRLLELSGLETTYAPGDTLTLELVYNEPGLDVTLDLSAFGDVSSHVRATETKDAHYVIEQPLTGQFKQRAAQVLVRASNADSEVVESQVEVQLRAQPPLPVRVSGALFVNDDLPHFAEVDQPSTPIASIEGSDSLIGQTATQLTVNWEPSQEDPPKQLIVRVDGFSGYYIVPLEPGQTSAQLEVAMPHLKPGDDPGKLRALLGLVGLLPKVHFSEFELKPFAVESEGIQFVLAWPTHADLDLAVRGPDGALIDFRSPVQGAGRLDLDANQQCHPSDVSAENIGWPKGKADPGPYEVIVNLYDSCGEESVDYELIVTSCGQTKSYPGTFNKSEASGTKGAGKVIDTIQLNCTNTVSGKVEYENGSGVHVLLPSVPVRAVRTSDEKVLARGFTDATGRYSLRFGNNGGSKYKVETEATWTDPLVHEPRVSVAEFTTEEPYRFRGKEIDGKATPEATEDLFISKADNSGAFNIINVMRRVEEWVLAKRNKMLPPIGARWSPGVDTPLSTSYFFSGQLFIQGVSSDPDEFDDPVIAHELMHYVVSVLSDDDSTGGNHNSGFSGPRLAWAEGIATGLGQIALGTPLYFDTRSGVKIGTDIEKGVRSGTVTPPDFGQGTSDGTQKGDVSEYLIAMVVWDLHDGIDAAGDPSDQFDSPETALFGSIFDVIPAADFDRGVLFTDFVDFLDGFRCMSGAGFSTSVDPKLRVLLTERKFNYDFLIDDDIGCSFK